MAQFEIRIGTPIAAETAPRLCSAKTCAIPEPRHRAEAQNERSRCGDGRDHRDADAADIGFDTEQEPEEIAEIDADQRTAGE